LAKITPPPITHPGFYHGFATVTLAWQIAFILIARDSVRLRHIWGLEGAVDMMDNLQKAFAYDIHIRRDTDEKFSAEGIEVISHDVQQGTVFEKNRVRVTAFLVDHGPVKPAYGYRVDYAGHSVALSGRYAAIRQPGQVQ
jgi:ribonuclease Z